MKKRDIRCWKCNSVYSVDLDLETNNGEVVEEGTPNSNSLIIHCAKCGVNNKIHVTNLKTYEVRVF
jgi:uncharacterized Zn finger protein